jgi:hypothetical protein
MASGESSVRRPARISTLAGSLAATLVVVELEEFTCGTLIVASTVLVVVVFGVVVLGDATLVVVVFKEIATLVVVVVVFVVVFVVVDAGRGRLVEVVFGTVLEVDVVVVDNVVVECSGREFKVKTSTSNSRGLDHISRCELRGVNRRRVMVIEG